MFSMFGKPAEAVSQGVGGAMSSLYKMIMGAVILKIAVGIIIVVAIGAIIYWVLKTCNHKNKRKR
ncbi:hypothetical protein K2W90_03305 [Candidatus Babeliales bacterium]|nr:hypothetical protein [Candidatus Babeliales bacterium]